MTKMSFEVSLMPNRRKDCAIWAWAFFNKTEKVRRGVVSGRTHVGIGRKVKDDFGMNVMSFQLMTALVEKSAIDCE